MTKPDATMHVLYADVLELILKKLPIDTRVALRVRPNRVTPSEQVAKTLARMARIAAHPNQLCWVLARVKGIDEPIKVMSYMEISLDVHTNEYVPYYRYITPCRTKTLRVTDRVFSPFLYWTDITDGMGLHIFGPVFDWHLEALKEYDKLGEVC